MDIEIPYNINAGLQIVTSPYLSGIQPKKILIIKATIVYAIKKVVRGRIFRDFANTVPKLRQVKNEPPVKNIIK